MPEAARVSDEHQCSKHGDGPILSGSDTVLIGGLAAARKGDTAQCPGAVDGIVEGEDTVLINGRPASRKGDRTDGGTIAAGIDTVLIGQSKQGAALSRAAADGTPFAEKCS